MPDPVALDAALAVLACPLCLERLDRWEGALRCPSRHTFDLARQGYVSFAPGTRRRFPGDTAEMVERRASFLGAGHFAPIADAIAGARAEETGWALDIAGGTGYYSSRLLQSHPELRAVTLDLSKHAARHAARLDPRLLSVTGDAHGTLPLRTGSVGRVLSVFGPRRADEIVRVLAPGGTLSVVTPTGDHLRELRETFGLLDVPDDKETRLDTAMGALERVDRRVLAYTVGFSREDALTAILMGPNAFHRTETELGEAADSWPDSAEVTVSVTLSVYRAPAA